MLFVCLSCCLAAYCQVAVGQQSASSNSHQTTSPLVRHSELNVLNSRAKIVVELEGKLKLLPINGRGEAEPREAEARAKSTLDYFEKIAFDRSELVAAARRYVEAKAENWIAGKAAARELSPECRETRLMKFGGIWQQFCDRDTMTLQETQLVHSPINTAALELFLPEQPAQPNTSWTYSAEDLATLFNLEAVHQSTVTARIAKVDSGVTTIELEGSIHGTANSVPTQLSIKGNLRSQARNSCAMITWLGLAVAEDREVSQSEPGFNVKARIRMIRTETEDQFSITDEQLRALASKEDAGRWLVRIDSPAGRCMMLGDRNWRTFVDSGEETILRLVQNNTIIAQCNISRLNPLDEGSQLTIEGLEADIKQTLRDRFEAFLESNERVTSSGLRLLRSVVSGSAEEVPIQWIYNQFSDDSGQRISMVFTMGANMTDEFAAADEQMIASLELQDAPEIQTSDPTADSDIHRSAQLDQAPSSKIDP